MPEPTRFSAIAAPAARPIPLWILYPLFFVAIYIPHWRLLPLPWFWDEAGYYIPAALDFFHTGSLIPTSTMTNAHPPLPSILLGEWWRLGGYHIAATRSFLCMIAAAALLGVFRLARTLGGDAVAVGVTVLTAVYPVWFVQSTMAHADLFAAAFTIWAISLVFDRPAADKPVVAATLFTLAALSKETAIVTPIALALWELTRLLTERTDSLKPANAPRWRWLCAYLFPVLPLALWYAYHHHVTGFTFGNPEFLRYNATANLTPVRILTSLLHRVSHLTLHMGLWVPTLLSLSVLWPLRQKPLPTQTHLTLTVILLANTLAFSVLGGALLTRYLLPLYPLLLILHLTLWRARTRLWPVFAALTAAAFVAALFFNPPYAIAPEDNLTYRDFILLHQQAARVLTSRYPAATVLTAWPATTELANPILGYVPRPLKTSAIDNFSVEQVQRAAADPGGYDTALVFSTKWVPPVGALSFLHLTERSDAKYYDFHRDLSPREIATLLHGEVVWQQYRNGEWAAILHFNRVVEARLMSGAAR